MKYAAAIIALAAAVYGKEIPKDPERAAEVGFTCVVLFDQH